MVFDCEEAKVKETLLDLGYYQLGFYSYYFQEALATCGGFF
jgi:hypothetical protein